MNAPKGGGFDAGRSLATLELRRELVMKNVSLFGLLAVLSFASVACGGSPDGTSDTSDQNLSGSSGKPAPTPEPAPAPAPAPPPGPLNQCTPLSATIGLGGANPASLYCTDLGYTADGDACVFPDGTQCEQWAFWRGECGGVHSFCARQGGTIEVVTDTSAGWTAVYAVCTLPDGRSCKNAEFAATCRCE